MKRLDRLSENLKDVLTKRKYRNIELRHETLYFSHLGEITKNKNSFRYGEADVGLDNDLMETEINLETSSLK